MERTTTRETLATDILAIRNVLEWTQDEMAQRLQVSGATVSRWESGLSIPRPEHLARLADLAKAKKVSGRSAAVFLARYHNIREQEQISRSVNRAEGILESHQIGAHTVALMEDGSLLVNGNIRIG
jgi:transcriptional regulator with XRE-family HTH domain